MGDREIDRTAQAVLRAYPSPFPGMRLIPLFNAGGFSGACLWRIDYRSQSWCLRAWPANTPSAEHLANIHALMREAQRSRLSFVPELFATSAGQTWIEAGDRKWEITRWMPGRADFHETPTRERLQAACRALAELHRVWARGRIANGPCHVVQRRILRAAEWTQLVRGGWRPQFSDTLTERAWSLVCRHVDDIPRLLAPRTHRFASLQPCLCDIWHDHVLYEGERVSGVIDYGSVKMDHVTADVARLLGSLIEDDEELWQVGTTAYANLCPWTEEDTALARLLDETGTVLGVANWLRWLYHDQRCFDDDEQVLRRFSRLVRRLERWDDVIPRAVRLA